MKNKLLSLLLLIVASQSHAQIITTIAGGDTLAYSGDGGLAIHAGLYDPSGVAIDNAGNVYIADRNNNRIRKVDNAGIITTIAGNGTPAYSGDNGPALLSEINYPYGIAVDTVGNIYFTDNGNFRVRKIDRLGIITTIAGIGTMGYNGDNIPATSAQFVSLSGIAVDANSNIYITDFANHRISKINSSGTIKTIAGTGTAGYNGDGEQATIAQIAYPADITLDVSGNIFFSDYGNNRIRKINVFGTITTIAGTGVQGLSGDGAQATLAKINRPLGICIDKVGNIFFADTYNNTIREIDIMGDIMTIAGTGISGYSGDGSFASLAMLFEPAGINLDKYNNLYICDLINNRIRYVRNAVLVEMLVKKEKRVILCPNPSNGAFTATIQSEVSDLVQIEVTNAIGEKFFDLQGETNNPISINIDLSPGIYFLSATTIHGIMTQVLMISK